MKVTIHYCPPCGLREPAERIAEALERELSLGAQVETGFWGTFRVECDGEVIFNRWKDRGWLGRLGFGAVPTPEEILPLVRERLKADTPEQRRAGFVTQKDSTNHTNESGGLTVLNADGNQG